VIGVNLDTLAMRYREGYTVPGVILASRQTNCARNGQPTGARLRAMYDSGIGGIETATMP